VLQDVQDKALLDGLFHGVAVEGAVPDCRTLRTGVAEDLQRLVLGCGGKRKIAGVRQHLARFHNSVDGILRRLLVVFAALGREGDVHLRGRTTALTGVGLVDKNGEGPSAVFVADLVEDKRELLDGRDDDLFARAQEAAQIP
jgi:hypothetical protein